MSRIICILILLTSCAHIDSASISSGAGRNTFISPIDHSDGESMASLDVGLWKHWKRIRYGVEISVDHRETEQEMTSVGSKLVCTYDIIQKDNISLYTGLAGGLGYTPDEYDLFDNSTGITGLIDIRLGIRIWKVLLEYRMSHISRVWHNDPGSNADAITIGFEWEF